ncbi:MAG: hypothetical protein NC548_37025 [Lachnospiraceae bacterium]|nr:hypothetical protein [Lachnospiraceae bacterium]MCM1234648.1 hypothetical protein [Ruminococcus flavefaciens]
MKLYHISLFKHKESIEREGIKVSPSGLDGPGIYAWIGPFSEAMKNADESLSDNHYELNDEELHELYKTFCVFEIDVPDGVECSVIWPEYLVLKNPVPPENVKFIGSFYQTK